MNHQKDATPPEALQDVLDALDDEAFSLLQQHHEGHLDDAALERFAECSEDHAHALEEARWQWQLFAQAQLRPEGQQRRRLAWQRQLASFQDRPQQLWPVAAAILLMIFIPFYQGSPKQESAPQELAMPEQNWHLQSPWGENLSHSLPDGSLVTLNWNSDVEISYQSGQRRVKVLKGEALFQVAKDPQRPFIVSVNDIDATAIGTEYSVRRVNGQQATIAVSEGVVEVKASDATERQKLEAGQLVQVKAQHISPPKTRRSEEINAWREGILAFHQRPLKEVLQSLDRYTYYDIKSSGLLNADEPVTATFFVEKTDEAISSLIQMMSLQSEWKQQGGRRQLLLSPAAPSRQF